MSHRIQQDESDRVLERLMGYELAIGTVVLLIVGWMYQAWILPIIFIVLAICASFGAYKAPNVSIKRIAHSAVWLYTGFGTLAGVYMLVYALFQSFQWGYAQQITLHLIELLYAFVWLSMLNYTLQAMSTLDPWRFWVIVFCYPVWMITLGIALHILRNKSLTASQRARWLAAHFGMLYVCLPIPTAIYYGKYLWDVLAPSKREQIAIGEWT